MSDETHVEQDVVVTVLAQLKAIGRWEGYRFEVDADGTERMYRPDGSLAVTARPKPSTSKGRP